MLDFHQSAEHANTSKWTTTKGCIFEMARVPNRQSYDFSSAIHADRSLLSLDAQWPAKTRISALIQDELSSQILGTEVADTRQRNPEQNNIQTDRILKQ